MEVKIGGRYRHYKGNEYIVHNTVRHSETLDLMVFYECLYENPKGKLWVRPLDMFTEEVQVHGNWVPRFELLS
jgi:hypothetical protein